MKKFKLTAQHYDMEPGTIVYQVSTIIAELFTINKDLPQENLRIIPLVKVEAIE
jgi:hypothetical protein